MLLVTSSLAATVPIRWVELDSHEKWNLKYTVYTRNFYHDRLMMGIKRTTTNCMIQIPSSKQPPKMNGEVKKVDGTQWSLSIPELFLFQVPCCIFNSKVFESTPCPPTRVTIEFPWSFPLIILHFFPVFWPRIKATCAAVFPYFWPISYRLGDAGSWQICISNYPHPKESTPRTVGIWINKTTDFNNV